MAIDFMGNSLNSGQSYGLLNVSDESNREALAIEVDFSLHSTRVSAVLDDLVVQHGAPPQWRFDDGPKFIAEDMRAWFEARGIALAYIEAGKANQNAYTKRANCSFEQRSSMSGLSPRSTKSAP